MRDTRPDASEQEPWTRTSEAGTEHAQTPGGDTRRRVRPWTSAKEVVMPVPRGRLIMRRVSAHGIRLPTSHAWPPLSSAPGVRSLNRTSRWRGHLRSWNSCMAAGTGNIPAAMAAAVASRSTSGESGPCQRAGRHDSATVVRVARVVKRIVRVPRDVPSTRRRRGCVTVDHTLRAGTRIAGHGHACTILGL